MKPIELELIKKLLMFSNREDHLIGLAKLTKNRGPKRLKTIFDRIGTEDCSTISVISNRAWVLRYETDHYQFNYYKGKKYSFYISEKYVYLVKHNHPHGRSWNLINI